jgi:CRP-like cAMP-binding protein
MAAEPDHNRDVHSRTETGSAFIHPLISNLEQRGHLSKEDRDTLLAAIGRDREAGANEAIIREGDKPWESTVLIEGFAARYQLDVEGKRQITALHVPGDFVDLHSFLLNEMDHGVLAISPCQLSAVPHDALQKITNENPHLTRLLWLSTLIDATIHRRWLAQMGGADAYRRTAHLICELFVRLKAVGRVKDNSFNFPLTQADFGDTLGMSNIHMNRTIVQLRSDGLITWKSQIVTVHDWPKLKEIARFDPAYLNLRPGVPGKNRSDI